MEIEIAKELKEAQKELLEKVAQVENQKASLSEVKEMEERVLKKIDALEISMKRPNPSFSRSEEAKAFETWLRKGIVTETKALYASEDPSGGYLAPTEFVAQILKTIVEVSPIRNFATVRATSMRAVKIPRRTSLFSAQWVIDKASRPETTGLAWGIEEIPTHELYARVDVSLEDLEDAAFNLENELTSEFGVAFGRAEGTAFVSGNAVGRPEGILTHPGVATVISGNSSALTYTGLLNLYSTPKTDYIKNSAWFMNRRTLIAILSIRDTAERPIFLIDPTSSLPLTIFGKPVVETPDMPDIASNAFPIVFGDMKKAYLIVDRVPIAVQRDPFSQASNGLVCFHARKRTGGQVVMAEAIAKQRISA